MRDEDDEDARNRNSNGAPVFSAREKDFEGANDEAIALRIQTLLQEHRDLDAAITALETNAVHERLTVARLKKKKLLLRDQIERLKNALQPDIIA